MISCAIMQKECQHRVQRGRLPIWGDFQPVSATFHFLCATAHGTMAHEFMCHHAK